jgi:hypothetical protein
LFNVLLCLILLQLARFFLYFLSFVILTIIVGLYSSISSVTMTTLRSREIAALEETKGKTKQFPCLVGYFIGVVLLSIASTLKKTLIGKGGATSSLAEGNDRWSLLAVAVGMSMAGSPYNDVFLCNQCR